MNSHRWNRVAFAVALAASLSACSQGPEPAAAPDGNANAGPAPVYSVDPFWPKPLPNDWILGQVAGVAVDARDHVWIVHRPRSITAHEAGAVQNPPTADCCVPAPSVLEFDQDGNLVQAWGGPTWDQATASWIEPADWPSNEHGIFVDSEDNVWLAGNSETDHVVMKRNRQGESLLTIGRWRETGGSNDVERLGRPADIAVDVGAREVYVADGYLNRRVIVFDADTGAYKRHWGAYGNMPGDSDLPAYEPGSEPTRDFRGPVHAVRLASDGLVYVADRTGDRIQVFRHDGTFVKEALVAPWTRDQGSVWDIELSPFDDERWLFVADGHNKKVWILERDTLEAAGSFGRGGRQAGQFEWVHNIAADSSGNLYTTEVNTGKRVQRFLRVQPD